MRNTQPTDQQLQRAIVKRFDWSPDITSERIGVAVTTGAVTLSGEARTVAEKEAAIHAATRVAGVDAVVDNIVVAEPETGTTDAEIARAVHAVLDQFEGRPAREITARIHGGVVTLAGVVENAEDVARVRRAVEAVAGVIAVVDDLQVLPVPTAVEALSRVGEALVGGVEHELGYLRVGVDGHVVTLEGNVHSTYERRVAERAAQAVPGVTQVRNDLIVAS